MTPAILETNLRALQSTNPELAEKVRQAQPIVPTLTDRDPKAWSQRIVGIHTHLIAILGIGDGRHVLEAAAIPTNPIGILVFEADLGRFHWALEQTDLSALLSQPRCRFIVAPDPRYIRATYNDWMILIGMNGIAVGQWPSTERDDPAFYQAIQQDLLAARQRAQLSTESRLLQRWIGQANSIANLPRAAFSITLESCKDALKGFPAFLIGAGPSLDTNGHLLTEVGDRGALFCVDTAYKALVAKHIKPHFFVTLDATPFNIDHIRNSPTDPEIAVAYHPGANFTVVEYWAGNTDKNQSGLNPAQSQSPFYLCIDKGFPLSPILEKRLNALIQLPKCANVLQLALYLAHHLGCDPLILVGCDLAYPRDGGRTHASDTAHSRKTSSVDRDETVEFDALFQHEEKRRARMMMVDGIDGKPVPTATPLHYQRVRLENDIQQMGLRVIDSSAAGAHKNGTIWMELCQAIREFALHDGVQASLLRIPSGDGSALQFLLDDLKAGRKSIAQAGSIVSQGLDQAEGWIQQSADPQLQWPQVQYYEDVTLELRKSLAQVDGFWIYVEPIIRHQLYLEQKAIDVNDRAPGTYLFGLGKKYQKIYSEMLKSLQQVDAILIQSLSRFRT